MCIYIYACIHIVYNPYANHIFPEASLWPFSCAGRPWAGRSPTLHASRRKARSAARRERRGAQLRILMV